MLEDAYLESGGAVVFEVESEAAVSPWMLDNSVAGYKGTGYFEGTADYFSTPGQGVVRYPIKITTSGRYQLQWRSRINFGTETSEHNDSWARLTDANGNPVSPASNSNVANSQWYKVYVGWTGWQWGSSNKDNDPRSLSWNLTAGDYYYVEISVRSHYHALDRIVLWDHNRLALANTTTGKGANNSALDALPVSAIEVQEGPDVEITDPVHGTTIVPGGTVTFTASASDAQGSVVSVEFFAGTTSLGIDTSAPFSQAWSSAAEGVYEITALATDNEGYTTTSAPITLHVAPSMGANGTVSGELMQWHKVMLTFDGPGTSETATPNPFRDYRMDVTFTGPSSQSYVVPGYYAADGNSGETSLGSGNRWRVAFAPDEAGTWNYSVSFVTGTDIAADLSGGASAGFFDGATGTFSVAASDKSGADLRAKGKLEYVGDHYLQFRNGEYFIKGGANSPEVLLEYSGFDNTDSTRTYSAHTINWQLGDPTWKGGEGKGLVGVINYLADLGLNSHYFLLMNSYGDGKKAFPFLGEDDIWRYDCSKLEQWDVLFEHFDRKGMMMHFVMTEQENQQLFEVADPATVEGGFSDSRRIYFREMVARFGHHMAITWNIGEENGWEKQTRPTIYAGACSDTQRKDFSDHLRALLPYEDHISIHNGPSSTDAIFNALVGHTSFTGPAFQWNINTNIAAKTKQWRDASIASGHKWVFCMDEPYLGGNPNDAHDTNRKQTLWPAYMAGAAGVEWYIGGGQDLQVQDYTLYEPLWTEMGYAVDLLEIIPFHAMEPNDALLTGETGGAGQVLADLGASYLAYLPNATASASLNLSGQSGNFDVMWYDPRNGGDLQMGSVSTVTGGGIRSLGAAPSASAEDWLVLVFAEGTMPVMPGDPVPPALSYLEIWNEGFENANLGATSASNADLPGAVFYGRNGLTAEVVNAPAGFSSASGQVIALSTTTNAYAAAKRQESAIDLSALSLKAGDTYRLSFDMYIPSPLSTAVGAISFRWRTATATGNGPTDSSQATLSAGVHRIEYTGTFPVINGSEILPTSVEPFIMFHQNGVAASQHVYLDNILFEIESPQLSGFEKFADDYALIGGKTDDDDLDGQTNFMEFATGGNPTDPSDIGLIRVSFDGDGNARVSVPQRIDGNELGLSYTVYNRTSLTEGSWAELSTNAIFTSSIEGTAEYETYGYRFWVGTGSFSDRFFRVEISDN